MTLPRGQEDGAGTGFSGASEPAGWRAWSLERVLVLGGFISMVLADIILGRGDPSLIGILLVLLLPGFISTGLLLWRPRSAYYLLAGVSNSVLAIGGIAFGLFGYLVNPLAGSYYVAAVLIVLSAALALPAGIIGYLRGQAGRAERPLEEGIRSLHGLAAIAVVALSLGAIAGGSLAYQSVNRPAPTGEPAFDIVPFATQVLQVTSTNGFSPKNFNVSVSRVIQIIIYNEEEATHTFTYTNNGKNYSHVVVGINDPRFPTRFFVLFDTVGTVPFRSTLPQDVGLNGTMRVVTG